MNDPEERNDPPPPGSAEDLLKQLLAQRSDGAFVSIEAGRAKTEALIARKRADRGH